MDALTTPYLDPAERQEAGHQLGLCGVEVDAMTARAHPNRVFRTYTGVYFSEPGWTAPQRPRTL